MSKADLLLNDDFRAYRKKELEEGLILVRELLDGKTTPDYAKGVLDMLKRIILIPKGFTMTDKQRKKVDLLVLKDYDEFHFGLVKRFLDEE